jgi:regulator of protease activity HflC (stomatin/prohibitin superfamily)
MQEREATTINGVVMLVATLAMFGAGGYLLYLGVKDVAALHRVDVAATVGGGLVLLFAAWACAGFFLVFPNETKVLTLAGRYFGTEKRTGWHWTIPLPLVLRTKVSQRIQNFDSETLKVNDANGNPIEVAAVIVWRVVNTAQATFDVEDYEDFVRIQTETAVRHMASEYPYDNYEPTGFSLRANADQVTDSLHSELQDHLHAAGVEVIRTQLRRLAYAPEIAADMLRRQQAEAVVAARTRIVEGAVGMVEHALDMLSERNVVALDEERKAAMVSNLLVVLTSEHHAQPVVNAGYLYQ